MKILLWKFHKESGEPYFIENHRVMRDIRLING